MTDDMTRRRWFTCAAGGVGALGLVGAQRSRAAEPERPQDAREALKQLMEGNERFVNEVQQIRPLQDDEEWMATLRLGQRPFATILGCADSRIPPEMIFDQGFGDLFVIRVAGNVVDSHVLGSIEYAVAHLHTPLIMVLGHENCGAVTAALGSKEQRDAEPAGVRAILDAIEPAIWDIDRALEPKARVAKGVERNVRWSMRRIAESDWLARALRNDSALIVGAVVGFEAGRVRLLG